MNKYRDMILKQNTLKVEINSLIDGLEIWVLKLKNNFTIKLNISYRNVVNDPEYEGGVWVFEVEKMDYEFISEEENLKSAKNETLDSIIVILSKAVEDGKLIKYLDNWGFKFNDTERIYG